MMREGMTEEELYENVLEVAKQPPILLHEMYEEMITENTEEDEI